MGLEVVVRPVVFPNIRPNAPRVLSVPDNPESGIAVLSGGGGKFIGTSTSSSFSTSQQTPHTESRRQVTVERIFQKNAGGGGATARAGGGTINRDNFIDVERVNKVRLNSSSGSQTIHYAEPAAKDNVEVLEANKEISAGGS